MKRLQDFLRLNNPYALAYKSMLDIEKEESDKALAENRPIREYRMFFTRDLNAALGIHPGRLSIPISNEIAAVFIDQDGAPPDDIDVVIHSKHNPTEHHISFLSPNCDPMCYPILFPFGDQG